MQVALEALEEGRLIWVDDPPRPRDLDELHLVDLPRGATRGCTIGSLRGVRVDSLLAARVIDVTEIDHGAGDNNPGLFQRLPPCRGFEVLAGIGSTLGDAPRRA